jgi:hypothetical protein
MQAVDATFASTQVAAATLTVRQTGGGGAPVAGLTMWCTVRSPRRHTRTVVLDVASPPRVIATV